MPLGKYIVKEEKQPIGYLLDTKEYEVNLKYKNQKEQIVTGVVTSKEEVKQMKLHIYKESVNDVSGIIPGLEGVEFTIKLKSDVEKALNAGYSYVEIWNGINEDGKYVKIDKKRALKAQEIAKTYETIKTDSEGNAYTEKKLPYGKYIVKETKVPKDYEISSDFCFSITQDESEVEEIGKKVKRLVVNNKHLKTYIKLIKKDAQTGKTVTLSSSTFEIKACEDIYDRENKKVIYKKGEKIKQKIGATEFTSFTTNADNIVIPDKSYHNANDEKGTVVTPLMLPVGNYEITEIKAPDGFINSQKSISFKIDGIKDYDKDNEGDYVKIIEIKNEKPTGTLILNKYIVLRENVDKSILNNYDFSKICFSLIAKENIIDMSDGSILYKKGKEVTRCNLDKSGNLKISNLPMGIYEIKEVTTIDGLVLSDLKYEVNFKQKDFTTQIYEEVRHIKNETTIVEFSKKDITGQEELEGAKLTITDEYNNIIDSWISGKKTHKIEGLVAKRTYVLKEEAAPYGYKISNDIKFVVNNTSEVQIVEMRDEPILYKIQVEKIDKETQLSIKSKKFCFGIYEDKECKKIINKVMANEIDGTVLFENLKYGTYYIKELEAPTGYGLSREIVKVEINDKGVYANEKQLNEESGVYSFKYYNSILPVVQTSDDSNLKLWIFLFIGSTTIIGLNMLKLIIEKRGKLKNK